MSAPHSSAVASISMQTSALPEHQQNPRRLHRLAAIGLSPRPFRARFYQCASLASLSTSLHWLNLFTMGIFLSYTNFISNSKMNFIPTVHDVSE